MPGLLQLQVNCSAGRMYYIPVTLFRSGRLKQISNYIILLANLAFNANQEVRTLELLGLRIGDVSTRSCEIMIKGKLRVCITFAFVFTSALRYVTLRLKEVS